VPVRCTGRNKFSDVNLLVTCFSIHNQHNHTLSQKTKKHNHT
jgi:hypothetical protein